MLTPGAGAGARSKVRWNPAAAAALSVITCYGTLAIVGLLGALGLRIALNEAVWAGAIAIFAWVALLALCLRWRRHGLLWPTAIAAVGVAMITFAMLVAYDRILEIAGFALLCAGTWYDRRAEPYGRRRDI